MTVKSTFWILVLLMVFAGGTRPAYAWACKERPSLEEAFIKSDVVFLGTKKSKDGAVSNFQIKELYKASGDFSDYTDIDIALSGLEHFKDYEDLIIFAHAKEGESSFYTAFSCGASIPPPQAVIEHVKAGAFQKSKRKSESEYGEVIFTGRVLEATHQEVLSEGSSIKPEIKSEIEFQILEWLQAIHPDPAFTNQNKITINVNGCGQDYSVGQSYLVFAYPQGEMRGETYYIAQCEPGKPYNLHVIEILRDLSPIFNTKGQEDAESETDHWIVRSG